MIKFENTKVMNFEGALRGMRNPLESWVLGDSEYCKDLNCLGGNYCVFNICDSVNCTANSDLNNFFYNGDLYVIGEKDMKLALKLTTSGSDHRKFLRQIFISVDITAPLHWWKEFDTYKVGTVANSTSTMHKLGSRELTAEDFSFDDEEGVTEIDADINEAVSLVNDYIVHWKKTKLELDEVMKNENSNTEQIKGAKRRERKAWRRMIQMLPDGFLQTRTVTMSYENARAIYHSDRRNHRQTEWRVGMIDWLKSLPYSELITVRQTNADERVLVKATRELYSYAFNEDNVVELDKLYELLHALEPALDRYKGVNE